jgi:hypothetical protein
MEDRFSAIRAAIGTAGPGDVVVILGRGHKEYMEYGEEDVSIRTEQGLICDLLCMSQCRLGYTWYEAFLKQPAECSTVHS